jgi:hypothetical protein
VLIHTQEGNRPLNAGCPQHTALLHIPSLHIMTHHAVIKSGHLNNGLTKSLHWSRGPENSTKIYRNLPLDMILSLLVITSNAYNLLPQHSRSISDNYHHFHDMVGYSVQTATPIMYARNYELCSWTVQVFYFSTVFCGFYLTKDCILFINIHQNCNR